MVCRIFIKSCELWPNFLRKYRVFVNGEDTIQVRAKCEYHKLRIFLAKFWHLKYVSSFKIDQTMAISCSKFKWAGKAQFLSHALQNFKIYKTFEDVEMMSLGFFGISLSLKFPNFPCDPAVQSSRGP